MSGRKIINGLHEGIAHARGEDPGYAPGLRIFWSREDEAFVAIDLSRPGCSAVGFTEMIALAELQEARKAWDGAAKKAGNPILTFSRDL